MARNFPQYTQIQQFFSENYTKEEVDRIGAYERRKMGIDSKSYTAPAKGGRTVGGMPVIQPLKFAKEQLRKEREMYEHIAEKAKQGQSKYEMLPPDPAMKDKLYDGFTREGKGRYQYLRERSEILPELRYTFPITSSAKYGWKIGEEAQLQKPRYARSRMVRDTFYTRNGVPDLGTYGQRYATTERGLTFS